MPYGNDSIDALRSAKRLLGEILTDVPDLAGGAPHTYDVSFVRTDTASRPNAVIRPVGGEVQSGSAYVRTVQQDYEFFVYPPGLENEPIFSELEAQAVKSRIDHALGSGGFGAFAMRIPVFDYANVKIITAATPTPVPDDFKLPADAQPYDYLPVSNLRVEARQDPDEDDLYTVVGDFRLSWMRHGDVRRFEGQLLQDVMTKYAGS